MQEIKLRAMFRKLSNSKECWQKIILMRNHITSLENMTEYTQVTDWEQYIGVNTKNGKEIYEGDIIHRINRSSCCGRIKYEETQIVKWEGTGFYGFPLPDSPLGSCGFADISSEEVEIIGNIHENPELLKEK